MLDKRTRLQLQSLSIGKFTDVQAIMVPAIIKGRSLAVISPPSSGKTAGYIIPILDAAMKQYWKRDDARCNYNPQFVVIASTARGVRNVFMMCNELNYGKSLKINCIDNSTIGPRTERMLGQGTDILITTPPALMHALKERVRNHTV